MKNVGAKLKNSLLKRQDALYKFKARREEFLLAKEQAIKEIEEARILWNKTLEQLPVQPFRQ